MSTPCTGDADYRKDLRLHHLLSWYLGIGCLTLLARGCVRVWNVWRRKRGRVISFAVREPGTPSLRERLLRKLAPAGVLVAGSLLAWPLLLVMRMVRSSAARPGEPRPTVRFRTPRRRWLPEVFGR
jgi:hypothetical protein